MGFDDLARHLASRDRKKMAKGNADEILAEAAVADRRQSRTADLVLGLILLGGGLGVTLLGTWSDHVTIVSYGAIAAMFIGAYRIFCGIRGKRSVGTDLHFD